MKKNNFFNFKDDISEESKELAHETIKLITSEGIVEIDNNLFFEYAIKIENKKIKNKNRVYYLHNISLDNISNDKQLIDNIAKSNSRSIEEEVIYNIQKEREISIIKSCTKSQRDRYIKYVYFGYSFAKIAELENVSEGAIRKSIKKVFRKIRQ